MLFAQKYIAKLKISQFKLKTNFCPDYIVIIPCYNEPKIEKCLQSLTNAKKPKQKWLILLHINSGTETPVEALSENNKTIKLLKKWIPKNNNKNLHFSFIHSQNISKKDFGAGIARKIAMDEAVNHFNSHSNENGIIVSLDADSTIEQNYFSAIENFYAKNNKANGANIYFEHPVSGNEFNTPIYEAIIKYELHLRYFVQSLRIINFPFSFHTIGSCFSVKAKSYIQQGGMNKNQAGEDFYFLQKLIELGNFYEINSTCVYPSPRISNRVLFGTGPEIKKMCLKKNIEYKTYNFQAFLDIEKLFDCIPDFFDLSSMKIQEKYSLLPHSIKKFISFPILLKHITEIKNNASTLKNFTKRFFRWFNTFQVIKFLNYSHQEYYEKELVEICVEKLLEHLKYCNSNTKSIMLLQNLRKIDKS